MQNNDVAISIDSLRIEISGTVAVKNVSFELFSGEALGLLGGNGSGKTSVLNAVCGIYPITAGKVRLFGKPIASHRPDEIIGLGVGRSLQSVASIKDLTLAEYVALGVAAAQQKSSISRALPLPATIRFEREALQKARSVLDELSLARYGDVLLQDAPYGVRKLADVARVFASQCRIVLLDEPTSGVGSEDRAGLADVIRNWHLRQRASLILIDHDVHFVASICSRAVVLSSGEVLAEGEVKHVLSDEQVMRDFLGIEAES